MASSPNRSITMPTRPIRWRVLSLVGLAMLTSACRSLDRAEPPKLIYTAAEFQAALLERVPDLRPELAAAPFIVTPADVEKAEARIYEAPLGPDRVRALVAALSMPKPTGFGLQYHWLASGTAMRTLTSGQGNCVSFASVLVGLGRGLGWPIYYAEARARRPETHVYEQITFVADHMVVVVAAKSFQMVIDFTGQIDDQYVLRPIDDLTAYAHLVNNIAGQHIARTGGSASQKDWERALEGFELATRIQPNLGRAWNNRGIALTRLERFDEAQLAYEQALTLDVGFDSAQRNLEIMQTRAEGKPTVAEKPVTR